jgi:hypothetical protein
LACSRTFRRFFRAATDRFTLGIGYLIPRSRFTTGTLLSATG